MALPLNSETFLKGGTEKYLLEFDPLLIGEKLILIAFYAMFS
jgi:hypothetical protein